MGSDQLSHRSQRPEPLFFWDAFKSKGRKHLSSTFAQTPKISVEVFNVLFLSICIFQQRQTAS